MSEDRPEPKLELVSDNVRCWEWESYPRREPKPARERLGPLNSDHHLARD
jgi:hypothetical protein